jgi:predicted signal transduction protein with EAL and GGDEF domain
VRWNHPTEGAVKPDEFIADRRGHGRIGTITDQVLGRVGGRRRRGGAMDRVSVNLSSHNLVQVNFASDVEAHLPALAYGPRGCASSSARWR